MITDLVQYIALSTKKFFEGTKRENDFYFYHDALAQLIHADTVAWMKITTIPGTSRTIYDCWIKPELGLLSMFGKRLEGHPVGNSAELMPHDNSLNMDVIESGRLHVVMSRSSFRYGEKDPRMFSFSTPKEIASVYKRINHPATGVESRPARIVQDVHKAVQAMAIHEYKGAFVPGLADGRVPDQCNTNVWIKTSKN